MGWRQFEPLNTSEEQAPIVVVDQIKNAWRITHLDERAEIAGLCYGHALSDARAICPQVDVNYEDGRGDKLLLEAIADWCERYTPLVSLDIPDGIMLDITGCAHLFGGEKNLGNDLLERLFQQGFNASGAVAATPGAAWAASRFLIFNATVENRLNNKVEDGLKKKAIPQVLLVESGREEEALALLPLAGLRLDALTLGGLAKLGLRTIGQVIARPRAPLTRRFGKLLILRLDQALGHVEEAISPRLPVPELMIERKLVEPIGRVEDIEILIERLATSLTKDMERRGEGARSLGLALFRVDGKVVRLKVGTSSPSHDPQNICRLFKERLAGIHEGLDAGLGFEIGRLSAFETEACSADQTSLLANQGNCEDFAHLIDKLGARIGLSCIQCVVPGECHLPEETDRKSDVIAGREVNPAFQSKFPQPIRPLRLLKYPEIMEAIACVPEGPPVRFRWRRKLHVVVHVEGPERICDEWWHDRVSRHTRDYFRVEDDNGHRYWLYRQGLYGCETNSPDWYMHGIFA